MATLEYYDILLKPVITEKSRPRRNIPSWYIPMLTSIRSRPLLRDCSKAQRSRRSIPSTQTAREREGVWFMVSQQRPRKPL